MKTPMNDKVCLVTGANSGIGKATALGLAEQGARVVMVCRNQRRGEATMDEIKEKTGNDLVDLMIADLSSQQSIRQLAALFKKKYPLHVLINNAGVFLTKRSLTVDGIETTFAVNHLAYFLLTNLLLDVLKANAPARVINVSSESHRGAVINFDNLQGEKKYSGLKAYNQSKLANILFTYELAKKLKGTGITVNCLHPGFTRTKLGHDQDNSRIFRVGLKLAQLFGASPEKGAQTSIYLATSPDVENITGKYFINKKQVKSSNESYNEAIAHRLWQVSAELTKLDQNNLP
ncbi:MAG: SDR family oxidoreductase [Candidatus Heimdallarchaeota archaeon]